MANTFTLPELPGLRFPWYTRMPIDLWRQLRQFVYQRDNGACQYCGESTELFNCHCHHVLELSEGGTNHPSNLKTLCRECHKKRHPFMLSAIERLA
jgi:5-methylcytosine-specific restriction endonuclease McrA